MNLEQYRALFSAATLALTLIAVTPAISIVAPGYSGSEQFSELWLLGPNHMAEDYPFNIAVGNEYCVITGVGSHMGHPEYYKICVKIRNQTQALSDFASSTPSLLPSLYELQFFVADGGSWESPLVFKILNMSVRGDCLFIGGVSINGVVLPVNVSSTWDSKNGGFYYQLFFELWLYDIDSESFKYHDRVAGIWVNMTVS